MVKISSLEKATKILEQLKNIDSEIIELEKAALCIANGETELSLSLSVVDLKKQKDDNEKVKFDEDGSIVMSSLDPYKLYFTFDRGGISCGDSKKEKPTHKIDAKLGETSAMRVLQVLLLDKNNRRDKLMNKLKKFGFTSEEQ